MSQPPFDSGALAGLLEAGLLRSGLWGQNSWGLDGKATPQTQGAAGLPFAALLAAMPAMMAAMPPLDPAPGADLAKAAKAVAELWAAAASLSAALGALMGATEGLDPTVAAALRGVADPRRWFAAAGGLDPVASQMEEGAGPQARLTQAWIDMRRCTLAHQAVVLDAWLRAGAAFNAAAARAQTEERPLEAQAPRRPLEAQAPRRPLEAQAALALWATTADAVLMEAQRAEPFLHSQAAMLRAGAELRLAQRGLAEHWAEQFDLPSRTEMDEVHRTVTELRRELRALQRQAQGRAAPQP